MGYRPSANSRKRRRRSISGRTERRYVQSTCRRAQGAAGDGDRDKSLFSRDAARAKLARMAVPFDAGLMRRYDREGPRYTSYPTALQFHGGVGESDFARAAATSRGALERAPLSLYVHIPFCQSPCFYCGCNKIVTRKLDRADRYVERLGAEIERRSRYFERGRTVEQLHFGGGTPTFLPRKRLVELIDRLDHHFSLSAAPDRDYSIEIDPRTADGGTLKLLSALGFNRVSLGVQDLDERVQRAVNRVQDLDTVVRTYAAARALGFRSINFDLIYGLPLQTLESFAATLEQIIALRPDRLAVYGYAHLPERFKPQRQIRPQELPSPALRLALLEIAIERLGAAGYRYIGMDHFALPDDPLTLAQDEGTLRRCFQGYTTPAELDLVPLGVSAIGRIGDLYVQNHKSLAQYEAALEKGALPAARGVWMSAEDRLRKEVIHGLMCHGQIDLGTVERGHGIDFKGHFRAELERLRSLATDGLVDLHEDRIEITPAGRLLMRTVAMTFDAYLDTASGSGERLSRVI